MAKNSFVMYDTWSAAIGMMSDEQAGQLIKAVYAFREGRDKKPSDPSLAFVFEIIKKKLDEDAQKYDETCKEKAEGGKKGGRPKSKEKADDPEETMRLSKNHMVSKKPYGYEESKCLSENPDMICNDMNCNDSDVIKNSARVRAGSEKQPETQKTNSPSNPIDLDEDSLRALFKSKAVADAMLSWLQVRSEQGRFPPGSIREAVERARIAENKHGQEKCVQTIKKAIEGGYKRIIWEELDRPETRGKPKSQGFNNFAGRDYSASDIDDLEKRILIAQG